MKVAVSAASVLHGEPHSGGRLVSTSYGYEPFHLVLEAGRPLTPETLREALRLAPWWTIERSDGDAWLDQTIAWARDSAGGDSPGEADAYELLRTVMHATLQRPLQRAAILAPSDRGFHKTRRIVFGRLASGCSPDSSPTASRPEPGARSDGGPDDDFLG